MTMQHLFFQFHGRIPRRIFIFGFLFLFCLQVGSSYLLLKIVGLSVEDYLRRVTPQTLTFDLLANVIFVWPNLAIGIKRLHDIGWPGSGYVGVYGGLLLIYLLGVMGVYTDNPNESSSFWSSIAVMGLASFVFFVVMVFVPGKRGANQFGPDPL